MGGAGGKSPIKVLGVLVGNFEKKKKTVVILHFSTLSGRYMHVHGEINRE